MGDMLLRPQRFLALALVAASSCAGAGAAATPDFRFDVRPVLAKNCFACHGPDEAHREADLRLDVREVALDFGAIVPGDVESSELVRRITSEDAEERMPPVDSGRSLTAEEIEAIKQWVAAGAPYSRHWSYEPPERPPLPAISDADWARNAIDHFILARLDAEGLKPEPEADRRRLIRRLSLDLIGLPPTIEEVEEFATDDRPDAYERLVDRLLASPAYGEHWARKWLDLARYADTCGYEKDATRTIWPYRDWVIEALNQDMPFDQFTIEQLAGDLLDEPTDDQIIATAMHRNTMQNDEGGTDDEEFRVAAVIDRVNTTMQVWMGTTMGCCQCHTHKYDPFAHREYYELFAFFNQTADADRYEGDPEISTPSREQRRLRDRLRERRETLEDEYREAAEALDAAQREWEAAVTGEFDWAPLQPSEAESASGAAASIDDEGVVTIADAAAGGDAYTITAPTDHSRVAAVRLETLPSNGAGEADAGFVLSRIRVVEGANEKASDRVRYVRIELPDRHDYLALAEVEVFRGDENVARRGEASQSSTAYEGAAALGIDGRTDPTFATGRSVTHTAFERNPWWEVDLREPTRVDRVVLWNRDEFAERLASVQVSLLDADRSVVWRQALPFAADMSATLWTDDAPTSPLVRAGASSERAEFPASHTIEFHDAATHGWSPEPAAAGPHELTVTFAEPLEADDGEPLKLKIVLDQRAFGADGAGRPLSRFRLLVTDDPRAAAAAAVPADVRAIAAIEPAQRTPDQSKLIAEYFQSLDPELVRLAAKMADLDRRLAEEVHLDKTPIMQELPPGEQRTTRMFIRGSFLSPGEEVTADTPDVFPAFSEESPRNRLGLARWLVDRRNPLTARVAANRMWEQIFGAGIVLTSEDFGSQGALPTHPALLDWLAVELMAPEGGHPDWSLKHLAKTIVMSATYRQASHESPEKLAVDPENRLLSRGPRYRLSAEQIRDQALAASGLLSRKMFGPSVMPPQPDGVWQVVYSDDAWRTSTGEDRYRRGLYTFWRRTSPYPSAMALDATSRETCTIRRIRTNTPVAAFALLNDPVYVEAAQALARRIVEHGGADSREAAAYGFRRVLARPPSAAEVDRLVALFESQREHYRQDGEAAIKMATDPLGPAPEGVDVAVLAAWTVVGNVLLNLDETLCH
jgi:mono/diheme cytochrome c family protein